MAKRVCPEPGCPVLVDSGRCTQHRRDKDAARGRRQERGYGAEHDAERAKWAPDVAAGLVTCWRCLRRIAPGAPWDLGHDDVDRTIYRGPEHEACNRATSGRTPGG